MTMLTPPIAICYQSLLNQGIGQDIAFYSCREFSNGQEREGAFSCYDKWQGPESSMARKIAIREAARMYGFNPPTMDGIIVAARQIVDVLAQDPNGVYNSKPCGEQWNWYALACFFNWYFWLNTDAQSQVRSDIAAGNKKWAVWAMHFQTMCPDEVRSDPVYASWYNQLYSSSGSIDTGSDEGAADASWDRKGVASSTPMGPIPEPWPVLKAATEFPSIPGIPLTPCEPFPSCVVQAAMDAGLPMPCQPFPECINELAQTATLVDPSLEMTTAPDGSGTYVAQTPPSTKKSSSPKWLVPALIVALGAGVVGAAIMLSSDDVYEG